MPKGWNIIWNQYNQQETVKEFHVYIRHFMQVGRIFVAADAAIADADATFDAVTAHL